MTRFVLAAVLAAGMSLGFVATGTSTANAAKPACPAGQIFANGAGHCVSIALYNCWHKAKLAPSANAPTGAAARRLASCG